MYAELKLCAFHEGLIYVTAIIPLTKITQEGNNA